MIRLLSRRPGTEASPPAPELGDRASVVELLEARGPAQEALFSRARTARSRAGRARVVLRGVVEITNLCRVDCDYCPMRRSSTGSNETYVLTPDQVVDAAIAIRRAGIDVVFLQGGEIPRAVDVVADALPRIRSAFDGRVEVLLNLGNQSRQAYARLRGAGATSYILKHETADPELFEALRHESIGKRIACLEALVELGYRVGVGSIIGLPGQGVADVADDLLFAARSGADMASVSPLVPAAGTPLADAQPGDVDLALNAIAVLRLLMPTALIPSVSALERLRDGGQRRGLEAGANVITINFSPERFRDRYLIYGRDRFVVRRRHAHAVVAAAGLTTTGSAYV